MSVEETTDGNPSYFHSFCPPELAEILEGVEDPIEGAKLIDDETLIEVLSIAATYLTTEPGPNLKTRKKYIPEWLQFWTNANNYDRFGKYDRKLFQFEELFNATESIRNVGVLFAAGMEGHQGHQSAVDYMSGIGCNPCLLLEPNVNFQLLNKPRELPFLPLEVRLAMWSRYPHINFISVVPEYPNNQLPADLTVFYQNVFDRSGGHTCFADQIDPNAMEKMQRGANNLDALIRHFETPATTLLVEKLFRMDNNNYPHFDTDITEI